MLLNEIMALKFRYDDVQQEQAKHDASYGPQ
jgi:hypothetical protein